MKYSTSSPLLIRADWLWTATGLALARGGVLIENGLIAAVLNEQEADDRIVKANLRDSQVVDLESSVITPGLFNLHTHLDYSQAQAIDEGLPLFTWMAQLVGNSRSWTKAQFETSALAGAQACALAGTSYVVDSSYTGLAAEALAQVGLKGLVGLELFGLDESAAENIFTLWSERYHSLMGTASGALSDALEAKRLSITIAPHAPYTVSPALWKKADQWARAKNLLLTAHLAESKEECDWLENHSEIVDQYLRQVMPPGAKSTDDLLEQIKRSWSGQGRTAAAHLAEFDLLSENLIAAHCVQLTEPDFTILATAGARAAICRRSNKRLLTGQANMAAFNHHQIKFGLGTDSLASCSDLSLLKEAGAWLDQISAAEALSLITTRAAEAVNLSNSTGSLTVGKAADLAIFPIEKTAFKGDQDNLNEALAHALIYAAPPASDLLIDGKFVVRAGKVLACS